MKKFLIGRSPLTTLAGYILAIVTGIHEAGATGATQWQDFLLPVAIALFGRMAADDGSDGAPPPLPAPSPLLPDAPEPVEPTNFLRRGKLQRQRRSRSGRFATL